MVVDDQVWVLGVRVAGLLHFIALVLACMTPIPPNWEENLAKLPEVHRRFAIAQNIFIINIEEFIVFHYFFNCFVEFQYRM